MASAREDARRERARGQPADLTGEDFLFHLYRGSELLSDNRVHEAKEELESALKLQPLDPKGQDLLANVYFRLGMYPRAIEIFEQLLVAYPDESALRVNLALCCLKTGQPQRARELLELTVRAHPEGRRAWGYLGLAHERLGDYLKAREAFSRAKQDGMARRMEEILREQAEWVEQAAGAPKTEATPPSDADFAEIDATEAPAPLSAKALHGDDLEAEANRVAPVRRSAPPPKNRTMPPAPASMRLPAPASLGAMRPPSVPAPPIMQTIAASERPNETPTPLVELARGSALVEPRDARMSKLASGLVLVRIGASVHVRGDCVRGSFSANGVPVTSEIVQRRARGKAQSDLLGGALSPILLLSGSGYVLIAPRFEGDAVVLTLDEDLLYIREDLLLAFDDGVSHESGRLALGDGDAASLVQLRGRGTVVVELPKHVATIEVSGHAATFVRHIDALGWAGRLLPRALLASEAPLGARGLVSFTGDGFLFVATGIK